MSVYQLGLDDDRVAAGPTNGVGDRGRLRAQLVAVPSSEIPAWLVVGTVVGFGFLTGWIGYGLGERQAQAACERRIRELTLAWRQRHQPIHPRGDAE